MEKDSVAFPAVIDNGLQVRYHHGLTCRDYVAIKAMQGICAGYWSDANAPVLTNENIAKDAYKMADAMIKESQNDD